MNSREEAHQIVAEWVATLTNEDGIENIDFHVLERMIAEALEGKL